MVQRPVDAGEDLTSPDSSFSFKMSSVRSFGLDERTGDRSTSFLLRRRDERTGQRHCARPDMIKLGMILVVSGAFAIILLFLLLPTTPRLPERGRVFKDELKLSTGKSVGGEPHATPAVTLSLTLETAVDVDGDIRIWRKGANVQLLPQLSLSGPLIAREITAHGGTGQLQSIERGVFRGWLSLCSALPRLAASSNHAIRGGAGGSTSHGQQGLMGCIDGSSSLLIAARSEIDVLQQKNVSWFGLVQNQNGDPIWHDMMSDLVDVGVDRRLDPAIEISMAAS